MFMLITEQTGLIMTVEVVPIDCAPEPVVTATWISTELIVSI